MKATIIKERLGEVRAQYKPAVKTWLKFSDDVLRFHTRIHGYDNPHQDFVGFTVNPAAIRTEKQLEQLAHEYEEALVSEAAAILIQDVPQDQPANNDNENGDGANPLEPIKQRGRPRGSKNKLTHQLLKARRKSRGGRR